MADEVVGNSLRPILRKFIVVLFGAPNVGMSTDLNLQGGIVAKKPQQLFKFTVGFGFQLKFIGIKKDVFQHYGLPYFDGLERNVFQERLCLLPDAGDTAGPDDWVPLQQADASATDLTSSGSPHRSAISPSR